MSAEHGRDGEPRPPQRKLLDVVNEITVNDVLSDLGESELPIVPTDYTPERYTQIALNTTKERIEDMIATAERGELSDRELLVFPKSFDDTQRIIQAELVGKIRPSTDFNTDHDDIRRSKTGRITGVTQYREIHSLEPIEVTGENAGAYTWYMRATSPVGGSTAEFPERRREGENPWVNSGHPEQLILRRKFPTKYPKPPGNLGTQ